MAPRGVKAVDGRGIGRARHGFLLHANLPHAAIVKFGSAGFASGWSMTGSHEATVALPGTAYIPGASWSFDKEVP